MPESVSSRGIRESARTRPDELIAGAAADSWGVFGWAELLGFGLSKDGVMRRERSGVLIRRYRGVYVLGWFADAPEARALAAVKAAGPGAVLSHRAAAWLWGFLENDESKPEVTVPSPRDPTIPGVIVHRGQLDRCETMRHRKVPITTPARTLIDLAAVVNEPTLRQAVRRAQGHRRIALPSLLRAMGRLGPRRGSATLRRIIATGAAPTKSILEDVVLDLLLAAGFEHPDVNKPLILSGRRVVPDFRWPRQHLILEADSSWHDEALDRERQALLEAHGELVLCVTWEQAVRHPEATVARVAAAGAPRAHPVLTRDLPRSQRLG
jgi:hypothetical protein